MSTKLTSINICGFRSLKNIEIQSLGNINVLIGANGAGKSNFIRFFEMMSWMIKSHNLGGFVEKYGGANDQLFFGSQASRN